MYKYLYMCIVMSLFVLLYPRTVVASRNSDIVISIDGGIVLLEPSTQPPVIVDGRVLVPVRGVFEHIGFDVRWDGVQSQAILEDESHLIVLTIGSSYFTVNDERFELDVPAQLVGGSTLLPMRAVLEQVGYYLNWVASTRTVYISSTPFDMPVGDSTARSFVYYYQRDPRWRDEPFGGFTVGRGGCGPTAVAMVASTLHGEEILPCYVATWGRNFYVSGIGASHALFSSPVMHEHFRLSFRAIPTNNEAEILEALRGGALMITSVQSQNSPNARTGARGIFTINPQGGGGHIAVLHGVTEDGNILVASPMLTSTVENTAGWALADIVREMHSGVGVLWTFYIG